MEEMSLVEKGRNGEIAFHRCPPLIPKKAHKMLYRKMRRSISAIEEKAALLELEGILRNRKKALERVPAKVPLK